MLYYGDKPKRKKQIGRRDTPVVKPPTIPIPAKPYLHPDLHIFITAFYDLTGCRYNGMGIGAIPYTAMLIWVDRWCLSYSAKELFLEIIPQLDNIYFEYIKAEQDKADGGVKRH